MFTDTPYINSHMGPMYIETPYINSYMGPMYIETPYINSYMSPMYIETPYINSYMGPMYIETPYINSYMGPMYIETPYIRSDFFILIWWYLSLYLEGNVIMSNKSKIKNEVELWKVSFLILKLHRSFYQIVNYHLKVYSSSDLLKYDSSVQLLK